MKKKYRSRFWSEFHARFRKRYRYLSTTISALDSRIIHSTFYGWIARNLFPRDLLPQLKRVLDWSVTEHQAKRLGVILFDRQEPPDAPAPATFRDMLHTIDKGYRKLQVHCESYSALTQRLFQRLNRGTFFVYTASTVLPLEFRARDHDPFLERAIATTQHSMAQAVLNGCLCLYVGPSEQMTEYYRAWGYAHLLEREEVIRGVAAFEAYTIRAAEQRGGPDGRMTEGQARSWVRRHLLHCTVDQCTLWIPGFSLALLGWVAREELNTAITLSLPGRHFGPILTYPTSYSEFRQRCLTFCRSLCEQALAALGRPRRGKNATASDLHPRINFQIDPAHRTATEALALLTSLDRLLWAGGSLRLPTRLSAASLLHHRNTKGDGFGR